MKKMFNRRRLIEEIQRDEYGIDIETDISAKKLIEKQNLRLHRALERLSHDLYSKDTHFVLELIQNAEDNSYDNSSPFIRFTINEDRIIVENNEKGFNEENVRKICDVGVSTKEKIQGFIGEKGIGFKSVFKVSDEPHIFSNGYQFKFDQKEKDSVTGFIVPYWVNEKPSYINEKITTILLPFKDGASDELKKFNEVEPELILFLKKLKTIEIHNLTENEIFTVQSKKRRANIEILHSDEKDIWRIVKSVIKVPDEINEEKRKDIKETEITLAFRCCNDGTPDTSHEEKAFAFLPIREYGFKFIIQADFLLPANREDIHKDNSWNIWIRDNVSDIFLKAVNTFKRNKNFKYSFYGYIPLEDDIEDDFFLPAASSIHTILKNTESILTESGNWFKPDEVLTADDDVRNIFSNNVIKELLGMEYKSPEIEAEDTVLDILGVKEFGVEHLIKCLSNLKWLKKQKNDWFSGLYALIDKMGLDDDEIEKLQEMKILKLANNQMVSAKGKTIFYPLHKKSDYGFENELTIIKRAIVYPKLKEKRKNIRNFLNRLDVLDATQSEIIRNHIIPIYESEDLDYNWESKRIKQLRGYIFYIKDYFENPEEENKEDILPEIKNSIILRINKEKEHYAKPEHIYLPKIYGNNNNLEKLFEGMNDILFLHKEYHQETIRKLKTKEKKKKLHKKNKKNKKNIREQELKKLREFLKTLGVTSIPRIEQKKDIRSHKTQPWNEYIEHVVIYKSPDICSILDQEIHEKNEILFGLLDKNWEHYSQYMEWTDLYFYRMWCGKREEADWFSKIKNSAWLPSTYSKFTKPCSIYMPIKEIKKLLNNSVPYLTIEAENQDFMAELGIKSEVSAKVALCFIESLKNDNCNDKGELNKLYHFLSNNYEENDELIYNSFKENTIIFIPDSEKRFFNSTEVIWKDNTKFLSSFKGTLSKIYPKLRDFFVNKLGISPEPEPKDFADVLRILINKEPITAQDEKTIMAIYSNLNRFLDPENDEICILEEEWWEQEFINEGIIWIHQKIFWKNDDDIFINDDKEIFELFKDKPSIGFLEIPFNFHPKIQNFIDAVKIKHLSTSLESNILKIDCEPKFETEATNTLRRLTYYILCYLYQLEYNLYDRLKNSGKLSLLKMLNVYTVKNLTVELSLNDENVTAPRTAFYDKRGKLYVKEAHIKNTDYLAVELSKLFDEPKGLDGFLVSLFDKNSDERIRNLMRAKGINDLPKDEWNMFKYGIHQFIEQEEDIGADEDEMDDDAAREVDADEQDIDDAADGEEEKHTFQYEDKDELAIKPDLASALPSKEDPQRPIQSAPAKPHQNDHEKKKQLKSSDAEADTENKRNDVNDKHNIISALKNKPNKEKTSSLKAADGQVSGPLEGKEFTTAAEGLEKKHHQHTSSKHAFHASSTDDAEVNKEKADWEPSCSSEDAVVFCDLSKIEYFEEPAVRSRKSQSRKRSTQKTDSEDHSSDSLSQSDRIKIGRWGEKFTYGMLRKKFQLEHEKGVIEETKDGFSVHLDSKVIVNVNWLNKNDEEGEGCDITILHNNIKEYIEIKSSKEENKDVFNITSKQWKTAQENGDNYCIYRVYNSGTEDARIEIYPNPFKLWSEGKISVHTIRIRI